MQKNWLSYDEQLDLLTRRGMWIEDESAGYRRKRGALDGVSWV